VLDTLNGDHTTVYPHEFKRTYTQDYLGLSVVESNVVRTTNEGKLPYSFPSGWVPDDVNSTDMVTLYNNAVSDLYEQLRSGFDEASEGLDLSIDAAESSQVLKMVGDVGKLIREFKRSPFVSTQKMVRAFGNDSRKWAEAWLTWQYGVRPLYNSVYGSYAAIMQRRLYHYVRVEGKAKFSHQGPWGSRTGPMTGSTETVYRYYKARCKIACEFEIANTTRQKLAGWTSLNPVSIAWELTPYSFVADWVWNIGGYLRSLEGALLFGSGFKRGYVVYGVKSQCTAYMQGNYSSGANSTFVEAEAYRYQSFKRRLPVNQAPLPLLPRVRVDLGSTRLLSAASLLRVLLK
jgi:hypothetical protein